MIFALKTMKILKVISEFQKLSLSERGWLQNRSCENEFHLRGNKKSFSYEWMRTSPRFKTEDRGNSEKAYSAYGKDLISQERTMLKDYHTVVLQKTSVL